MKGERDPFDLNEKVSDLLADGIREIRSQRGRCPDSERLVAFYEKRLPEEEAAGVQAHVQACGLCDFQLGRLEAGEQPQGLSVVTAFRTVLQHPAFAYGLVALLLWPAYQGFLQSTAPELEITSVPSLSLDLVRSESQTQKSSAVNLLRNEKFFLLSFFAPMQMSPRHEYEVLIIRNDQTNVAPAQVLRNCDKVGNCVVLCNGALFESGRFELLVREAKSQGGRIVHRFSFEVTRYDPQIP